MGTKNALKKQIQKTHTTCRRCGRTSFHIQKKVCSACGYPSARMRTYNWGKKMIRRKNEGTGRMRYMKTLPRKFKNGFREGVRCAPTFALPPLPPPSPGGFRWLGLLLSVLLLPPPLLRGGSFETAALLKDGRAAARGWAGCSAAVVRRMQLMGGGLVDAAYVVVVLLQWCGSTVSRPCRNRTEPRALVGKTPARRGPARGDAQC